MCSITPSEIQELLDNSVETTSFLRVEKILSLLKMCFNHAVTMNDVMAKKPVNYVKLPDEALYRKRREIVVLENDQIVKFEKAAKTTYSTGLLKYKCAPLLLLLHTGLRRGELLALKWEHVDFKNELLHVIRNLVRVRLFDDQSNVRKYRYEYVEITPKTRNSVRDIYLNDKAIAALILFRENCKMIEGHYHGEYIARTRQGEPLKPPTFDHVIKRTISEADIQVW